MELKIDVFQSFSCQGRFETPWLESLGFANQREETTCHWNVYTSKVITCERDKEGQIVTSKFVSHCKVSFPFHHFQEEHLPWGLLSRWICRSVVRSSHAADLFSHILSPVVRERVWKGAEYCRFELLQFQPGQLTSWAGNRCSQLLYISLSTYVFPSNKPIKTENIFGYLRSWSRVFSDANMWLQWKTACCKVNRQNLGRKGMHVPKFSQDKNYFYPWVLI